MNIKLVLWLLVIALMIIIIVPIFVQWLKLEYINLRDKIKAYKLKKTYRHEENNTDE